MICCLCARWPRGRFTSRFKRMTYMMQGQNAEGLGARCVRWFRAIRVTVPGILVLAASSHAGVLTASWTAPTTNTDGSQLIQLARYRIYYGTSDSPCPGDTFFEVASPSSNPPPDQTVSVQMTGLTTGWIYSVSVTAMDTYGNESACSEVASAIAQDASAIPLPQQNDSALTPTVQDATTPTVQDGSDSTLTPQSGIRRCLPGQAKKGRC